MRALPAIAIVLLASLGPSGRAEAHVPLWAPRVSLSLALDWNQIAVAAVHAKQQPKPPARVHRHTIPKLTVTAAAPPPAPPRDVAAYGRVETFARDVLIPHYANPDVNHRVMFREFYLAPYTPYLGAYGVNLAIETDALLR